MIPLSRNLPLCLKVDGKTMRSRENNFFGFFLRRLSRSKVRILTNHFGKLKTQPKTFNLERSHSFSINVQRYLELSVCSLDRYWVPSWLYQPDMESIHFLEPCLERFRRPRSHTNNVIYLFILDSPRDKTIPSSR